MKLPTTMTARMSRGRTQDWAVEVNENDVCMQGKRGRMPFFEKYYKQQLNTEISERIN